MVHITEKTTHFYLLSTKYVNYVSLVDWKLAVMFDIWFWNCFNTVTLFVFHFNQNNRTNLSFIDCWLFGSLLSVMSHFVLWLRLDFSVPDEAGLELTNLVAINTDCKGSCKFNYHMITTATCLLQFHVLNAPSIRRLLRLHCTTMKY